MADPINLNKVREAKTRAEAKTTAAHNRAAFGVAKADRSLGQRLKDKAVRDLDAKKRET